MHLCHVTAQILVDRLLLGTQCPWAIPKSRPQNKLGIRFTSDRPATNRDQGHLLPAIYNQIIPPKPETRHMTPGCDEDPQVMDQNVTRFQIKASK